MDQCEFPFLVFILFRVIDIFLICVLFIWDGFFSGGFAGIHGKVLFVHMDEVVTS